MDFLTQSTHQWLLQWRESPARARWTIGIALALGCATLALAIFWPRSEPRELLFDGVEFSRSEMTAMEAAFGKAQLNEARVVDGRFEVPAQAKHLYMKALFDQQALPATFFTYAQRSLATDHPFASPRQREAAAKLAKEQEIALILRKISGIEEASVQYEDSDLGGFPRRRLRQATAAVRARGDRILDLRIVNAIRATLMNTLGISTVESITVLDLNAGVAHSGLPVNTPSTKGESREVVPATHSPRVAREAPAIPASFAHPPRGHEVAPLTLTHAETAETSPLEADLNPRAPLSANTVKQSPVDNSHDPARMGSTHAPVDRGELASETLSLPAGSSCEAHSTSSSLALWNEATRWAPPSLSRWLRDNAFTLLGAFPGLYGLARLVQTLRSTRVEGRRAKSYLRGVPRGGREKSQETESVERARSARKSTRPALSSQQLSSQQLPSQQLHDQIQGDPSGAAATLRQWLGNAA
jgi:flagellar biosynthesis/type III secretory pathway M-ring protein FliF/YscJ